MAKKISEIDELIEKNEELRQALISNREDTGIVAAELGEAYTEINNIRMYVSLLETQQRNSPYAFIGFGVGMSGGTALLTAGIMSDNLTMSISGGGVMLASCGGWLLGHFVFKKW